MSYFKARMSSSDLPNSRAILWREYERDGGTWMRERIRGEQGEGSVCVCMGGYVRTCTHRINAQKHTWDTCINAHTTAGYLHTVIAWIQLTMCYCCDFTLHFDKLIKGLLSLTLPQELFLILSGNSAVYSFLFDPLEHTQGLMYFAERAVGAQHCHIH